MIKLILPGSIRIKKNSRRIFGAGRKKINIPSKAYEEWERTARLITCTYMRGVKPVRGNIHAKALIYYKGPRPDLSGAMESIGDCLEGFVWKNDKQIVSWDGTRLIHDKNNPRTEVEVEILKED